jgi:hypothetical protein
MNIFEAASRLRIRFNFKGQIPVEDLWVLPLESLDDIYKDLNSQIKQVQEESLLKVRTSKNKELDIKIEIIKHIVGVRLEEAELKTKAKANREEKARLLEILANKKDEALLSKTPEEIQARIDELEG